MKADALSAGDKIGKYQIRRLLGQGGMGAVYLAFDPVIEREVALKVLSAEVANSDAALQRFLREARAIGRLNSPHVVAVYDVDQSNNRYFIVMELLSGGSVADLAERHGALPWNEACEIAAQAARGLAAAHAAGMIHRDIKPANLMRTADGLVKVVDFGLSKATAAADDPRNAVTMAGQILGTPQYMSPEQFESAELDARTDIYSLGATLFELLTGRFPYDECRTILQIMTAHLSKPPPVPTEFVVTIPAECNRIVARAMAKNLAERYATAAEMAKDLEALLAGNVEESILVDDESEVDSDRPLATAVIVEPSKLQAAVFKDALTRAGVRSVETLGTSQAAKQAIDRGAPDLLITAMQLPDGLGLDLIRELSGQGLLRESAVVLNSNDSTMDELFAAGKAACLVLAPKKVRPDEILRVMHAAGPGVIPSGPLAAAPNPAEIRIRVVIDSGRIPAALADLIRESRLLDVEVVVGKAVEPTAEAPHLVLALSDTMPSPGSITPDASAMTASVQRQGEEIWLRAVSRQGVVAVCRRRLDSRRFSCLLQACRP